MDDLATPIGAVPSDSASRRLAETVYIGFRDGPYADPEQLDRFVAYARLECGYLFDRSVRERVISDELAAWLEAWIRHMCGGTHYLYWMLATPGGRVSLTATWTTPNPRPHLGVIGDASVGFADTRKPTSVLGSRRPSLLATGAACQRLVSLGRQARSNAYSRMGLVPIPLSLRTPAMDHAASYYLEVRAPAEARVVLLDWQTGHVFGTHRHESDVVSARMACNVAQHHDVAGAAGELLSRRPRTTLLIKANVNHAPALGVAAAATAFLAFTAQRGGFIDNDAARTASGWIFLAPAAVVAYVASFGQHYFARYYRALRYALMVGALAMFAFGASALFDVVPGDDYFHRVDVVDDVASFGAFAAAMAVMLLVVQVSRAVDELDRWRTHRLDRSRRCRQGSYSMAGQWVRTGRLRKHAPLLHPWRYERRDFGHMYMFGARRAVDRFLLGVMLVLAGVLAAGVISPSSMGDWGEGRAYRVEHPQQQVVPWPTPQFGLP